MPAATLPTRADRVTKPAHHVMELLENSLKAGASTNLITWIILGGSQFMAKKPVSGIDFVTASNKGIPKLSVINLAEIMDVPMKDIAALLNVSYKTLGRKKSADILDSLASSLSIEIAHTIAKGLSVFESPDKLCRAKSHLNC
ncbi:MAG: hypothetical protein NVS3B15_03880 [Sediminibacterium sp.]